MYPGGGFGKHTGMRVGISCTSSPPSTLGRRSRAFVLASSRVRPKTLSLVVSKASRCVEYKEASDHSPEEDRDGLVFYTHSLCPYAQRVWCALEEKQVNYTMVQIDLSNKPVWYGGVNSGGLVPVVEYGGRTITESRDICRWINDEFCGPSLLPSDEKLRDCVELVCKKAESICESGLQLLGGSTSYSWGIGESPSRQQIRSFESNLNVVADCLAHCGGPFLGGERVTLADVLIFPFMERFALAMPIFSGYDPSTYGSGTIRQWLISMQDRDATSTTMADRSRLLQAFRQHRRVDFFDYSTYHLDELHPHLFKDNS